MQWRVCASHVNKTWVISQICSEFRNDLKVSEFWSAKLVGRCKRLNDRVCLAAWLSWSHPAPGGCWNSGKEMGSVTGAASLGHSECMTAACATQVQGHFIVLHPLLAMDGHIHFTKQKTLPHFSSSLNCPFSVNIPPPPRPQPPHIPHIPIPHLTSLLGAFVSWGKVFRSELVGFLSEVALCVCFQHYLAFFQWKKISRSILAWG